MKKYIFDYARMCKKKTSSGLRIYGDLRNRKNIKGLVIHFTDATPKNTDTAKNNCDYFATGIDRQASAHIFIDYMGLSARSLPLNRVAFSVGNPKNSFKKGAYYSTLNNSNTVSIELCAIVGRPISNYQKETLIKVAKWVKKKCPNLIHVVRHYDIVQKECPKWYVDHKSDWLKLQSEILTAIS
jgi:N-acetylmuramoyl-L-alanine amidase CwlA